MTNLLLAHIKTHITNDDLNRCYGEYGMSFGEARAAHEHQSKLKKQGKNSYITRLVDYNPKDVETGIGHIAIVKDGARKRIQGYLVTVINNKKEK